MQPYIDEYTGIALKTYIECKLYDNIGVFCIYIPPSNLEITVPTSKIMFKHTQTQYLRKNCKNFLFTLLPYLYVIL